MSLFAKRFAVLLALLALGFGAWGAFATACSACTPAQDATIARDLPAAVAATGALCTVLESTLNDSPAGPVVDLTCMGAVDLEQLGETILASVPKGATAITTKGATDAGVPASLVVQSVPLPLARAIAGKCMRNAGTSASDAAGAG